MDILRFNKFVQELSKDIPVKVAYKDESKLMKFLGAILFFNKGFMDLYITTLGNTVYYPSRAWVQDHPTDATLVMAHEYVHMKDNSRLGKIKYPIMYLFPQVLAVLSLLTVLAFFTPYAWFFLTFLLCAAPIPAPGRKYIELRGYKMSLYALYLNLSELNFDESAIARALMKSAEYGNSQFTGAGYYFMWPKGVESELKLFATCLLDGSADLSEDYYTNTKQAFENSKENTI